MNLELLQKVRCGVRVSILPLGDKDKGILLSVAKTASGAEMNISRKITGVELDTVTDPADAVAEAVRQMAASVDMM